MTESGSKSQGNNQHPPYCVSFTYDLWSIINVAFLLTFYEMKNHELPTLGSSQLFFTKMKKFVSLSLI